MLKLRFKTGFHEIGHRGWARVVVFCLFLLLATPSLAGRLLTNLAALQLHQAVLAAGPDGQERAARLDASEALLLRTQDIPGQGGKARTLALLAQVREAQEDWEGAAMYLEQAVQQEPGNSLYRRNAALTAQRLGLYALAITHWRATKDGQLVLREASKLTEAGQAQRAIPLYRLARELAPDLAEPYLGEAAIYDARKEPERADEVYREALEALPDRGSLYVALANRRSGSEGERVLLACVERAQNPGVCHAHLGDLYLQAGRTEAAERERRQAASAIPQSGDAWSVLGDMLFAQGRYQEAADSYRHAEEQGSHPVWRFMGASKAGGAYLAQGNTSEAVAAYQRALAAAERLRASEPQVRAILLLLAEAQASAGREDEARKSYQQVLAADPGNGAALQGIAGLARQ